jgi:hypothetical protein
MKLTIVESGNSTLRVVVAILLLMSVRGLQGQGPMPQVADKHFCQWWQAKIGLVARQVKARSIANAATSGEPLAGIQDKIDDFTTPATSDPDNVKALNEKETMAAMGCFLQLEENTHRSSLLGATWAGVSQLFDWAPVNLAALYYVSYLYTQNWKHGNAIALRGPGAEDAGVRWKYATTQAAIRTAYKSYRTWFARVNGMGLAKARAGKLSPLDGTGLSWY